MTSIRWISFINKGYLNFAYSFIAQAPLSFLNGLHVYCSDEFSYSALAFAAKVGVTRQLWDCSIATELQTWGSVEYHKVVFAKIDVLADALQRHGLVGFIDFDIAMYKDPTDYFISILNNDEEIQIVAQDNTNGEFNTGCFVLRNISLMYTEAESLQYKGNQPWMNDKAKREGWNVFKLPVHLFPVGSPKAAHIQDIAGQSKIKQSAYLVHFNFCRGEEKYKLMEQWGWKIIASPSSHTKVSTIHDYRVQICTTEFSKLIFQCRKLNISEEDDFLDGARFLDWKPLKTHVETERSSLLLIVEDNDSAVSFPFQNFSKHIEQDLLKASDLLQAQFVLSDNSNIQYEALLCGCIPVVSSTNSADELRRRNLPIIICKDFTTLTESYLINVLIDLKSSKYDYGRLNRDSHTLWNQKTISKRERYWYSKSQQSCIPYLEEYIVSLDLSIPILTVQQQVPQEYNGWLIVKQSQELKIDMSNCASLLSKIDSILLQEEVFLLHTTQAVGNIKNHPLKASLQNFRGVCDIQCAIVHSGNTRFLSSFRKCQTYAGSNCFVLAEDISRIQLPPIQGSRPAYVIVGNGLGNQLFQLAFGITYVKTFCKRVVFVFDNNRKSVHTSVDYKSSLYKHIKQLPGISFCTEVPQNVCVYEEDAKWTDNPLAVFSHTETIVFDGYFQKYKYAYEANLASVLDLTEEKQEDSYFLHIRGGDYLHQSHHLYDKDHILTFYRKALLAFDSNTKFYVVTNDKVYAKKIVSTLNLEHRCTFTSHANEIDAITFMRDCKGGICSNSSFSLWSILLSALGTKKNIVVPNIWFPKDLSICVDELLCIPGIKYA